MACNDEGPMRGQTVFITGATRGIGLATAVGLAGLGAQIAMVGRDRARTEVAAQQVRAAGGPAVHTFLADLSSQADVRRLADEALERLPRIDVLINNAGGFWNTRRVTADGLEHTLAVNHLAPFLLTNLLLPRLQNSAPARVVIVASNAQRLGRIAFEDLQGEHSYSGARAYNQSKLANVMFAYALARQLSPDVVTANAVHPGWVNTSFGVEDPASAQRLLVPLLRAFMASPSRGARSSINAAAAPTLRGRSGLYLTKNGSKRSSPRSYDEPTGARLWQVSADLVGLTPAD